MDTGQLELRSAVAWRGGRLEAIDQTLLPERFAVVELRTAAEVVDALRRLAIRGAPAIGVAAAFGVVLGLDERQPRTAEQAGAALDAVAAELEAARPTAVNLSWAVRRVVAAARDAGDAAQVRRRALEEAERVLYEDRASCLRMAEVGCDRVARNGDTANKIGTYGLSVLARSHGIPFYVVGPLSSFDLQAPDGDGIVIEERSAGELRNLAGVQVAPGRAGAWNPAFDVTPAGLISGFITDAGVLRPPFAQSIPLALGGG